MVIHAISISEDAQAILSENHQLHVLHCFEHVWNLIDESNRVLSVVTAKIGNAPFNIVVAIDFLPHLQASTSIFCSPEQLITPHFKIDIRSASVWKATLSPQLPSQLYIIGQVCQEALLSETHHSLFSSSPSSRFEQVLQSQLLQNRTIFLDALTSGNESDLVDSIASLAGKGIGLTPTGDDWLMGYIIALYQSKQSQLAQQIASLAIPHTTDLSANLLYMAGQGKISQRWHDLLTAQNPSQIKKAISAILKCGYSSGADSLIGFSDYFKISL